MKVELSEYIEAKVIRRKALISFIATIVFECLSFGLFIALLFLTNFANEKNVWKTESQA